MSPFFGYSKKILFSSLIFDKDINYISFSDNFHVVFFCFVFMVGSIFDSTCISKKQDFFFLPINW